MRALPLLTLATLALASCVPAPRPVEAPPPAPTPPEPQPAPAPEPTGDWQDRALTPGNWAYQPQQGGSAALFGPTGSRPLLAFRCDMAKRSVTVSRAGAGMAGAQMIVRTSFGAIQWPATADPGPPPSVSAVRTATDSALDRVAFSRGRFAIEVHGLPTIIVPAWPEVTRVIEDCRG